MGIEQHLAYKSLASAFLYPISQPELQAEYVRLFGTKGLVPLEITRYVSNDEFVQARKMADIAGFYRAWGLEMGPGERPDNLSAVFDYLSFMHLKEENAKTKGHLDKMDMIQKAKDSFLSEHFLPSIDKFVKCLKANAKNSFYKELAELIGELVESERCVLTK